jgi:hypothetical protein
VKNGYLIKERVLFACMLTLLPRCYGRKKKNQGDEPIWVIIHIYMEMSQGNFLCSCLKLTKLSIFFSLLQSQRTGGKNRSCMGEVGTSGRGDEVGKGYGRVNMVQVLCIHVYKWKNDAC